MGRRSDDPTNQNTVPVVDVGGRPLMPTRPSQARRLIRQGRAKKLWTKGVFCVQVLDVDADHPDVEVDGVELNIDPGSKATGMAVVSDTPNGRRAHALIEVRYRGSCIRNRMDRRRAFRRGRRSRLRNRQPRFDNRSRPEGWLAPSLVTKLANTETWVRRLRAIFPVNFVRVETARFDTQIMENAEISGREYQQGDLAGWQLRSYVFHRDGATCAYCGSTQAERCGPREQPGGCLPGLQHRKGQYFRRGVSCGKARETGGNPTVRAGVPCRCIADEHHRAGVAEAA